MATTIVYDAPLSTLSVPDGLLIDVQTSQASSLQPGAVNEFDAVGTATWGQFNAPQIVDANSLLQKIGPPQVQATDLATFAKIALNAGVQTVKTVRVGSGSQIAAVLPLLGPQRPPLPPPLVPTLGTSAAGALAATTYYVKIVANPPASAGGGSTLASAEVNQANLINTVLTVTMPAIGNYPTGTTFSVYVSNTAGGGSGAETLQASGIAAGTVWTEPATGLVAGALPPTANTTGNALAFVNLTGLFAGSRLNLSNPTNAPATTATLTYSPGTPISMQQASGNAAKVYVDLTITPPLDGAEVFQNLDGNVNFGAAQAAPGAPTTGTAVLGALAGTTYYVKLVARMGSAGGFGTTLPSAESTQVVAANSVLTVTAPGIGIYPAGTTFDVYVSTATNAETLQANIAPGATWQEPVTGLVVGAALPTVNTTGGYSIMPATLGAAIIAAVNTGIVNGRAASQYFVASAATYETTAGLPIVGVANAITTNGTDGLDFGGSNATQDAAQLGSNTVSPPTGMYALSGNCSGGCLALIGNSDVSTVGGTLLAFAKSQNAHSAVCYPDGTPRTGASSSVDLKAQAGLSFWALDVYHGEWVEIVDADNGGIHRFVDPAAMAMIATAITPIPRSPANLNFPFVIGTSKLRSDGTINVPVGSGDALAMENAGVNYWTNDTSGAVGFTIAHNKNSMGKTAGTSGNIAYGRNLQFAIKTFNSPVVGAIVGGDQGFDGTDDSQRKAARALFNAIISDWQRDSVFDGTAPNVVCDLTNNSPGLGMLRVDVYLQQREIIDNVAIGLMSGVGPLIAVNPAAG